MTHLAENAARIIQAEYGPDNDSRKVSAAYVDRNAKSSLKENTDRDRGRLIARMLTGVWRDSQLSPSISVGDLTEVALLLLKSGAGSLGWWRVRDSDLLNCQASHELHQAYRLHTLQAAIHARNIEQAFAFLHSLGVKPLLGKGWAIARHYPQPGLRPYGDLDLYIRPEEFADVVAAFSKPEGLGCAIDLHKGLAYLDDRNFDDVYARSETVWFNNVEVRIPSPEDHLRLLCLHLLKEGAVRPLWLCDIGVAVENRSPDFDWEYFLSGNKRSTDWVICAIGLAHQLLGAKIDDTPVVRGAKHLPDWMISTVLKNWGKGTITNGRRIPMATCLRHPYGIMKAIRLHWPNPIEATIAMRGPFNNLPRLPFQIGDTLVRTVKFLLKAPKLL